MTLDDYKGKRVLVTGGLGFIGSNLARRLAELEAHVTLVDSLIPEYGGNRKNIDGFEEKVKVNISDVRDEHAFPRLIEGQDLMFNLAGQTSHLDSMTDPFTDLEINARAQLAMLEALRKHNPRARVVFASTRQIYGKPQSLPVSENHVVRPVDINGIHKQAGESYHRLYHEVYGIDTCSLRLTNTYGPRMRIKDARQTFVGIWIRLALEGKPFEVWGGEQLRDFTYVDDCVEAMLAAAIKPEISGKSLNIGGREVVSLKALADTLISLEPGAGFSVRQFPEERKKIDIGDFYSDDTLARELLGWEPKVDLEEGLRRTLEYFRGRLGDYT